MRRILVILGLIAPALVLLFLWLFPQFDVSSTLSLGHFYVVSFTAFSATVISMLLLTALGRDARPRHVLAATAFVLIGALFSTHGLATTGALITTFHPAIQWSAWLTLFAGSVLFGVASLDRTGAGGRTPVALGVRPIIAAAVVLVAAYFAVALWSPQTLAFIDTRVAPWHRETIFVVTLALWLLAAYGLWRTWRVTRARIDGVLGFVALWMAWATISMHRFPVWQLSWWMYHFILLVGFLITSAILIVEYERARQFRLIRYYVAIALVVTAFLSLVASALFSDFAYRNLVAEVEFSTRLLVTGLTNEIAHAMPAGTDGAGLYQAYADRLRSGLKPDGLALYAPDGRLVYTADPSGAGERFIDPLEREEFETALSGEPIVEIYQPGEASYADQPQRSVHIVESFVPLRLEDGTIIGVAAIAREAPELGDSIIRARFTGLALAALVMGLLFAALLTVVLRADRIITARTSELAAAYEGLRRSEAMRDDLTGMIVHDLRNPLTAISASIDLIGHPAAQNQPEMRARFMENARGAIRRMTGLIDDILTVSKFEAGEMQLQRTRTALEPLLRERVQAFAAQVQMQGKRITLDCPADLQAALDVPLAGRVLDNLLSNALKYTGEGGHIRVLVETRDGTLRVCVRDDGEGVPDAYKRVIFDKFMQTPESSAARRGTGLGLAFCRMVVEAHGGRIWVEDAPGRGSDFVFTLPPGV